MNGPKPALEPAAAAVERLERSYGAALDRLLPPGSEVVLLEYPSHENVGDHLIWLGETSYLAGRRDISVHLLADRFGLSPRSLARRLPAEATVLLHGGGNFGDIYPQVQRAREAIIEQFPHHRFLQLPQTVSFSDRDAARGTAAVLARHPDFTLLVRDKAGLEFARAELPCRSELLIDAAFVLGPRRATSSPRTPIGWIARRDGESALAATELPAGVEAFDWGDLGLDRERWLWRYRLARGEAAALAALRAYGGPLAPLGNRLVGAFDACSRRYAAVGFARLETAEVIVTDRLHGHIMCVLLGKPHVLLDNRDSKVRNFYETWTAGVACAHWADTPEQALALACSLLPGGPR